MSTSNRKKRIGRNQLTIFDLLAASDEPKQPGALDVKSSLQAAITRALKDCPLSRHQVAGEMSHLLNTEITKAQLDTWTAESKTGRHIPAEYLPALCRATGSTAPLEVLARAAGVFCLPGPDALRSEIQRLEDKKSRILTEIRKRKRLLEMCGHG